MTVSVLYCNIFLAGLVPGSVISNDLSVVIDIQKKKMKGFFLLVMACWI